MVSGGMDAPDDWLLFDAELEIMIVRMCTIRIFL